jgi:vacuolar fusion protein MON1
MAELSHEPPPKKPVKRQYFVLTHAGKPVFTDRTEDEADTGSEEVTNLIGVMHALISVFEDDQDKIRCIHNRSFSSIPWPLTLALRSIIAPPVRITFTIRPPLYYVCVSPSNEPESVVASSLLYQTPEF